VSGILGYRFPLGAVHVAAVCVTTSTGQTVCNSESAGFFASLGVLLFAYIAFAVLGIIAAVKVITKAGYSGWWILIAFVPIVGSIFVLVFAFSTWPVTREVEMLRARLAGTTGYGRPGGYGEPPSGGPSSGPLTPGRIEPTETISESVPIPSFARFIHRETGATTTSADAPGVPSSAPESPGAGWFPSPGGPPGQRRYWDGKSWTDYYG
jgi:uncharacterized membrane protein YhaH (DUF805 family)